MPCPYRNYMEYSACLKNLRVSARKLRLLADLARGKDVQRAIDGVRYAERKWSDKVVGLIRNAVNNASQNRGVDLDKLYVKKIFVDKGPTLKRFMTRARGGAATILKRTSSVTVVLAQK